MSLETYGSYQLIKRLATGGMAQIFLARQVGLEGFEKLLVLKRILPHLAENEEFIRMFLDEARIAARLNHPNVVQIFNLGQQDDSFFIAMEYIHGEDARRVWRRADQLGSPMPLPLVCRVVMDACAGLDYAHKKCDPQGSPLNIVHRDISPQNILVTFEGGVKVVDFGIAKAADQATVTRSGVLKGKYSYMSPEQAAGARLDCRSDIFALGVVLYELLTGTRLFKRTTDIQTLNAVIACQVTPPSQVNPRVPADLDPIVLKALARDPAERFQEAVHLQLALEEWLVQRRMSSSSAHLAAFMQEIYAERLAMEASEGHVVVEEFESVSSRQNEDSPKPKGQRGPTPRPTTSLKPPPLPPAAQPITSEGDNESTMSERPLMRREVLEEETRAERSAPSERSGSDRSGSDRQALIRSGLERAGSDLPVAVERPTRERRAGSGARRSISPQISLPQSPRPRASAVRASLGSEAGEMSLTEATIDEHHRKRVPAVVWISLVTFVLGGAGFLIWPLLKATPAPIPAVSAEPPVAASRPAPASVRVTSYPEGATVTFDGKVLAEKTPCTLPEASPGSHPIALELPGYQPFRSAVTIPQEGTVTLPTFSLLPVQKEPAPPPGPDAAQVAQAHAQTPAHVEHHPRHSRPSKVAVALISKPAGATVRVNGSAVGVTPARVELPARSNPQVRLELSGFRTLTRRLRVGEGPSQEETFTLEHLAAAPTASGTVAFVVVPWAEVTCDGRTLGETPFKDTALAAGTYTCTFANPQLGKRTRTVEVRPNTRTVVTVKFSDSP